MVITAGNINKIKQDNIVNLWNIYAREEWGCQIYPMSKFDDVLYGVKPSELLYIIDDFNINDDYFYYDGHDILTSGCYDDAGSIVVDFDKLAKDISKDPGRYKDEIECDDFAEILLYSTELDSVDWEELMVCYTPMEIETVRNAKITTTEAQALKELKEENARFNQHSFDEDIDYLLTYCRVEE